VEAEKRYNLSTYTNRRSSRWLGVASLRYRRKSAPQTNNA